MIAVSEIFPSLQGEGPLAGKPALFLRLAGCPQPHCTWCDSAHALNDGKPMGEETILTAVQEQHPQLVVITGGEPFAQWHTGLRSLAKRLQQMDIALQYETSGKAGIPEQPWGMVVCSPKPIEAPQLAAECISRVDAFKFVVAGDMGPVIGFVSRHRIAREKVWIMALGATRKQQLSEMATLWEECLRLGFNYSPRLHILAFDDRRGV